MRIKFYLKRPNAKTETALYALINYDGNTLKVYSGESILPKHWNHKTQSARSTPSFTESPEFNQRLMNIKSTINRVFMNYRNKHDHDLPSPVFIRPIIESALKKGFITTEFLPFFKEFAERTKSGQRVDPRTKKKIKGTGGKGYLTTHEHLTNFSKVYGRGVDFDTIDLDFYEAFTKYLSTGDRILSLNTVGSHIQRIKAVMREALDKGLTNNILKKGFSKVTEESDSIYLNEKELAALQKVNLSGKSDLLEKTRDFFLIGCYTGLRFSDFSILKPGLIKEGFIKITQTKTGDPVSIPVHPVVKKILAKYQGATMREVFNVRDSNTLNTIMNKTLKEIGKLVPELQETVETGMTKGEVRVIRNVPKWELLTTHTARRSFATNEYNAGTPTLTIMAVTGHKTEKAFLKYIRISPDEYAKDLAKRWEIRLQKSKLKAV